MSIEEEIIQIAGDTECLRNIAEKGCSKVAPFDLSDSLEFYSRHYEEIADMVIETMDNTGYTLVEVVPGWDNSDPLASRTHNRNLLAWFAIEKIAQELLEGM